METGCLRRAERSHNDWGVRQFNPGNLSSVREKAGSLGSLHQTLALSIQARNSVKYCFVKLTTRVPCRWSLAVCASCLVLLIQHNIILCVDYEPRISSTHSLIPGVYMSSSSYMIGIPGGDQHWCCMLGWSYPSLIPQAPVFACMGSAFPGSKLPMLPVQDNVMVLSAWKKIPFKHTNSKADLPERTR
ncbi:uncharacterized protein BDCG_05195 [Blastomyces dermatitidis ER-3]|uniref:Uncharacterized protein n=1 Tax=Ajellomyces dermatitidis (strain ER-3 / ATCC MYA-2586) TaxID=559297 RepID=A0ABX2VWA1_AJEDR|nr:uncharacterized protein BDCG_05195 [Blastomyces dermatitidis ER-3]OAT01435.1 hypothetical protein BDCG_05195 [Blastomyces dermatitidis ER-3]